MLIYFRRSVCVRQLRACLAVAIALVACLASSAAVAQHTGGSFGGSRWGAGSSPSRAAPASEFSTRAPPGPSGTFDLILHPVETAETIGIGFVAFLGFVLVTSPYALFVTVRMVIRSVRASRELRRKLR